MYIDGFWMSTYDTMSPGDEISMLGDSWMFLLWSSDSSPWLSNSAASRWPIAVIPASLSIMGDEGNNLTLGSATSAIAESFRKLAIQGIKIRDLKSRGGSTVSRSLFW